VGYIAEILTCLADQLVPVPPSISRAQEARGSLTGGSLASSSQHPSLSEGVCDYRLASRLAAQSKQGFPPAFRLTNAGRK
jgi:hypothetical protein